MFGLTLFFGLILPGASQAGNFSCTVTTSCSGEGEVVILRMSGTTNAHAELPTVEPANYDQLVCCSGVIGLGNHCTGGYATTTVLKLSGQTNAHVQQNSQSGYGNEACISVSVGESVSVGYGANCDNYDTTLASMSGDTNAHVGATTTYSTKICASAGVPTYEQSAYRWFENLNSTQVGATTTPAQNQKFTLGSAGAAFRLRMLLHVGVTRLALNGQEFKLQFAARGSDNLCDASFTGETYADVTAGTVIAYNDNAPADGDNLTPNGEDPIHGTDTIVNQDYEELNNFTNSVGAIPSGQDGKWDFALKDNGAPGNTTYCFRAIKSDNGLLNTYSEIPEITTAVSPNPSVTGVSLHGNSPIILSPGETVNVTSTATTSDPQGLSDIATTTGKIYRSGLSATSTCTPDANNCYEPSCATSTENGYNWYRIICSFDMWFHADPTDGGTYAGIQGWTAQEWVAWINVIDSGGHSASSTNETAPDVDVVTFLAFEISTTTINYGSVLPDETSNEQTLTVTTTGNIPIDVNATGTDMTWSGYTIGVNQQHCSTTTKEFAWDDGMVLSSTTYILIELEPNTKPTSHPSTSTDDIYWKLKVPLDKPAGPYYGDISLIAAPD